MHVHISLHFLPQSPGEHGLHGNPSFEAYPISHSIWNESLCDENNCELININKYGHSNYACLNKIWFECKSNKSLLS